MEQTTEKLSLMGKILRLSRTKKIVLGTVLILLGAYVALVIARIPHAIEQQKTAEAVAKIHAAKLTLDDVMGKNLPPDPGADADKTIEGVDVNHNGIRDDVELAIFKKYPNSAKIRAAELQYAMELQNELAGVFSSEVLVAIIQEEGRGYLCIGEDKNIAEVEQLVFNSESRKKIREDIRKKYLTSFSLSSGSECDISNL